MLSALPACGGTNNNNDATTLPAATFTENAVTAYHLADLGDEQGLVLMLVLVADGWVMDVSLGMYYTITPTELEGMAYEAVSDDVFRWKPSEASLSQAEAENANVEMRIVYSDPKGRYIVYSPNVETPDMANIICNPAYFPEIVDINSQEFDKNYHYFYKITDKDLIAFAGSMKKLPGLDYYKNSN